MPRPGKTNEAAKRYAERKQREDESPRLRDVVPTLATLELEIEESRAGGTAADAKYVRRIVVDGAPSLFLIPCGDRSCTDGGHDISAPVMRALGAHQTSFGGEDECRGSLREAPCTRLVKLSASATYR